MSEKRFVLCKKGDVEYIEDNGCIQLYGFDVLCEMLNKQQDTISQLQDLCGESDGENAKLRIENKKLKEENEQLKAKVKRLQDIATRTEAEKEDYADLYNECRRLKLSDEAIKQAYADLNRREREKHSQGNATYTAKMNWNEVIY